MSWTQGITEAKDLPPALLDALSRKEPEAVLECVSWYPEEPTTIAAHYYKDGKFWKVREFKWQ